MTQLSFQRGDALGVACVASIPAGKIEHRHSVTVLVAEDDAEMRALVSDALRVEGYHVVEVADGGRLLVVLSRGLQSEDRKMPDAVVSDIQMPVMTGLAMAAALRETGRRVPVVLMTAFPTDETRRLAHRAGATLIPKPFALERLVSAVRQALGTSR